MVLRLRARHRLKIDFLSKKFEEKVENLLDSLATASPYDDHDLPFKKLSLTRLLKLPCISVVR